MAEFEAGPVRLCVLALLAGGRCTTAALKTALVGRLTATPANRRAHLWSVLSDLRARGLVAKTPPRVRPVPHTRFGHPRVARHPVAGWHITTAGVRLLDSYKERMARMRENRRKVAPQKFFVGDRVTVTGRGAGEVVRVRKAACGFEMYSDTRTPQAWDYQVRLDGTGLTHWFGSDVMTKSTKPKKKKGWDTP